MSRVNDETAVRSNVRNIYAIYVSALYVISRGFYLTPYERYRAAGTLSRVAPTPTAHASKASDGLGFQLENPTPYPARFFCPPMAQQPLVGQGLIIEA